MYVGDGAHCMTSRRHIPKNVLKYTKLLKSKYGEE